MKKKDEIPPEIAILLEKREIEDRRAGSAGQGAKPENAKSPKKVAERRRRNRRKS